jgi:hypothetical protein
MLARNPNRFGTPEKTDALWLSGVAALFLEIINFE